MIEGNNSHDTIENSQEIHSQIQGILEESRGRETIPRIPLYRAIIGRQRYEDGKNFFEGISEESLNESGFFGSNKSPAQLRDFSPFEFEDDSFPQVDPYTKVPGLPVFLNLDEALFWISERNFKEKPAIAILDLPISAYFGSTREVTLCRNSLDRSIPNREITQEELEAHSKGKKIIRGECYLTGPGTQRVQDAVKRYQVIVRPKQLDESGRILTSDGFEKF